MASRVTAWPMSLVLVLGCRQLQAQSPADRTARYLESARSQPALLLDFLARMPKGGELHHHLAGSIYAESYINYAAEDGLCIERATMTIVPPPCDAVGLSPAVRAQRDFGFRNQVIDAWSIRNFQATAEDRSAEDHFFRTFLDFDLLTDRHWGEMLAEVTHRAGAQNVLYLETMLTPDHGEASRLGRKLGWNDDFAAMRSRLMQNGMDKIVDDGRRNLDEAIAGMRRTLQCDGARPDPGCAVTLRFQYQVLRGMPREDVFARMVAGFELASVDPRVVAVNPVMPQDDYTALHDFQLHLRMFDFLHKVYPTVHLSLHAGELSPGQVTPEELPSHIRDSIELGHAERIGHGTDILYERDFRTLMAEMARRHIAVEATLTTEEVALGLTPREHPLAAYLHAGVPMVLSTDDEGVARTELTWEFRRAVEEFHLGYATLKKMVRDSLDYAFLPGPSLWLGRENFVKVPACARETPGSAQISGPCRRFLNSSERARIEWQEEMEFTRFESGF